MLPILPHQLFFSFKLFSTVIEIVSKCLPQRNEVKNARQTQSHWLVALFSCNDWVFTPLLARAYFLCCIARSNNMESIFFVILQGHKQLATIAICKLSIIRSNDKDERVFYFVSNARAMRTTIFTLYCKGASNDYVVSQGSKPVYIVLQRRTKPTFNHRKDARDSCEGMAMMAHHTTINFFICCESK
jgi:hypothetical protein